METKRIVDINTYWAEIIRDTAQFGQIAVAENPEFNRLADCIFRALEDSFIHSATEYGVKRWESMLQIAPSAGETLEDRKARILTYLNLKLPYTWRVLKQLIEGIVGEGNVEMNLNNDMQTLRIVFNDNVDASVSNTIDDLISRVIPMNLVVECEYYLPAGYKAIDYIEGTGTQYINIPLNCRTYDIVVETEHLTPKIAHQQCEGASDNFMVGMYSGGGYLFVWRGWAATGSAKANEWNTHKVEVSNSVKKIYSPSGVREIESAARVNITTYSLFKTGNYHWEGKKRTWKVWIDGELKFDLIPVLDSQGVPCMYDKVNEKTYYNDGTGTFGYAMKDNTVQASGVYARLINGELDVVADTEDVGAMPMTLDLDDEVTPFVHFNDVGEAMEYYNIKEEGIEQ